MPSIRQITLRHPSAELTRRLKRLSQEQGKSLNATALELLERAVGMNERRDRLARYMTWSAPDQQEFDEFLAAQRTVDERDWK